MGDCNRNRGGSAVAAAAVRSKAKEVGLCDLDPCGYRTVRVSRLDRMAVQYSVALRCVVARCGTYNAHGTWLGGSMPCHVHVQTVVVWVGDSLVYVFLGIFHAITFVCFVVAFRSFCSSQSTYSCFFQIRCHP